MPGLWAGRQTAWTLLAPPGSPWEPNPSTQGAHSVLWTLVCFSPEMAVGSLGGLLELQPEHLTPKAQTAPGVLLQPPQGLDVTAALTSHPTCDGDSPPPRGYHHKTGASHGNRMSWVQGKPASGRSTQKRSDPTDRASSPVSGPRFADLLGAWDCLQVIHQSHILAAA